MASKKITALEYARLNGLSKGRVIFCINKIYKKDDARTNNQWQTELVNQKIIDSPIIKLNTIDQKNETIQSDSE